MSGDTTVHGELVVSGNSVYATSFYETSDENLKAFKGSIDVDLELLRKLPKKYFVWKDDETGELHIGTSAQELQKIYPELVSENCNGELTVDYAKLSLIALCAIDKLYEDIQDIKKHIGID